MPTLSFIILVVSGFAACDASYATPAIRKQPRSQPGHGSDDSLFAVMEQPKAGAAVQRFLLEFEDMARSGSRPQEDKISVIKKIVQDELMPDLKETHAAAKNQVSLNLDAIDQCNKNSGSRLGSIKSTTEVAVGKRRIEHSSCRGTEKDKLGVKTAKCQELDAELEAINDPVNLPSGRPRAEMVSFVKTMSDYYCPKGPPVEAMNTACLQATSEHDEQKEQCDRSQASFESGFCTWNQQLVDACDAHSSCYADAKKAYNSHVVATKELVKMWKVEYDSLEKIVCYTDVWMNDNNVNTADKAKLDECNKKKEASPNHPMDIDYGTPADQAQCSLAAVENHPGTPGFVAAEYANIDAVVEVIPCSGIASTQAASTATTVPAATPAGVTWNFYNKDTCEGDVKWSLTLIDGGGDMAACTKWKQAGGPEFYMKAQCNGKDSVKEVYFEDAECKVRSETHDIGKMIIGFSVDAANYAKETTGKCFTADLTHGHANAPCHGGNNPSCLRHGKLLGHAAVTFPLCQ